MGSSKPLRILLLQAENPCWALAKSYPYYMNFAWVEALRAAGVEVLMVTSPWFAQIDEICAGKTFDQIWLNDLSHFADFNLSVGTVLKRATIRIGFVTESVEYTPEEYTAFPWLSERRARLDAQFDGVTHLAVVDEVDVVDLQRRFGVPAMWLPCSMPQHLLRQAPPARTNRAFFSGSVYGQRAGWLETPQLQSVLARRQAAGADRLFALLFNLLPGHCFGAHRLISRPRFPVAPIYPLYLALLRRLRHSAFLLWQRRVLQQGAAVVNLPHLVKGYSGRVIEGMAAGRPVISWRIPERPRNTALFADGREILLYETPEELAGHIERVLADSAFAQHVAESARRKVRAFHTTEHRVRQLLDWVAGGMRQPTVFLRPAFPRTGFLRTRQRRPGSKADATAIDFRHSLHL